MSESIVNRKRLIRRESQSNAPRCRPTEAVPRIVSDEANPTPAWMGGNRGDTNNNTPGNWTIPPHMCVHALSFRQDILCMPDLGSWKRSSTLCYSRRRAHGLIPKYIKSIDYVHNSTQTTLLTDIFKGAERSGISDGRPLPHSPPPLFTIGTENAVPIYNPPYTPTSLFLYIIIIG